MQEDQYSTTPLETQERVTAKALKRGKKAIDKRNRVLERLTITYIPIDHLKPNPYNPNRQSDHEFELLCSSILEHGFTQPIIVQQDGEIVDGEHRWRAAVSLGMDEVPVVTVNMTAIQQRISTLSHNRARGSEDIQLSAQLLRDLQSLDGLDWAQDSLKISDEELNRLLEDIAVPEALAGEAFSQAWEPDKYDDKDLAVEGRESGNLMRAASQKASNDLRERERLLKKAKTEEQRATIREDANIFRISLVFSGDEAQTVRAVLGKKPAERLLELCQANTQQGALK